MYFTHNHHGIALCKLHNSTPACWFVSCGTSACKQLQSVLTCIPTESSLLWTQTASEAALGRVSADSVGTPTSEDARRRRLFPDRTLNPTFDRRSADLEAEAANNEAHGEGPGAAVQLRKQEVELAQLQSQLRATQAQVLIFLWYGDGVLWRQAEVSCLRCVRRLGMLR